VSQAERPLPLVDAAVRLRGVPGRPRKATAQPTAAPGVPVLAAATARLVDDNGAARYLGVSTWTVRDLAAAGHLRRVRLPLGGGREVRRILYDLADLDRLIERSNDSTAQ
jgi:excisionase family DNA binding protein